MSVTTVKTAFWLVAEPCPPVTTTEYLALLSAGVALATRYERFVAPVMSNPFLRHWKV